MENLGTREHCVSGVNVPANILSHEQFDKQSPVVRISIKFKSNMANYVLLFLLPNSSQ